MVIVFDERQVGDRAHGEKFLRARKGHVEYTHRSGGVDDEPWFSESPGPSRMADEAIHPQASKEVRLDECQHHDIRMPWADVAQISQIGLVDSVRGDAQIQDLDCRPESSLRPIEPACLEGDIKRERE